jgi:CheY-like chemotaxis protein
MSPHYINLLLADDDPDDCLFFEEILNDSGFPARLSIVKDGDMLMQFLHDEKRVLPDAIFLDLNMPRKNGFECLSEIKINERLNQLPVLIFTTSLTHDIVNLVFQKGAHYYIRKPSEFQLMKNIIEHAVRLVGQGIKTQPARENFVLSM